MLSDDDGEIENDNETQTVQRDSHPGMLCENDSDNGKGSETKTVHRQDSRPGLLCYDDSDDEKDSETQTVHKENSHPGLLCGNDSDDENGSVLRHRQCADSTVIQDTM